MSRQLPGGGGRGREERLARSAQTVTPACQKRHALGGRTAARRSRRLVRPYGAGGGTRCDGALRGHAATRRQPHRGQSSRTKASMDCARSLRDAKIFSRTASPERRATTGSTHLDKVNRLRIAEPFHGIAGWSSPVAREAHNLEVGGSNPPPATRGPRRPEGGLGEVIRARPPRAPALRPRWSRARRRRSPGARDRR